MLADARDGGRWLRVNWHPVDSLFVVSIWRDDVCAATFQLTRNDSPELISSLVRSLSEPAALPWSPAQVTRPKAGVRARLRGAIQGLRDRATHRPTSGG